MRSGLAARRLARQSFEDRLARIRPNRGMSARGKFGIRLGALPAAWTDRILFLPAAACGGTTHRGDLRSCAQGAGCHDPRFLWPSPALPLAAHRLAWRVLGARAPGSRPCASQRAPAWPGGVPGPVAPSVAPSWPRARPALELSPSGRAAGITIVHVPSFGASSFRAHMNDRPSTQLLGAELLGIVQPSSFRAQLRSRASSDRSRAQIPSLELSKRPNCARAEP